MLVVLRCILFLCVISAYSVGVFRVINEYFSTQYSEYLKKDLKNKQLKVTPSLSPASAPAQSEEKQKIVNDMASIIESDQKWYNDEQRRVMKRKKEEKEREEGQNCFIQPQGDNICDAANEKGEKEETSTGYGDNLYKSKSINDDENDKIWDWDIGEYLRNKAGDEEKMANEGKKKKKNHFHANDENVFCYNNKEAGA